MGVIGYLGLSASRAFASILHPKPGLCNDSLYFDAMLVHYLPGVRSKPGLHLILLHTYAMLGGVRA